MNISLIAIKRPVATTLITLALALAGCLALVNLPISALPQVEMPTITVSALLPGASAETMAATVATPLERALGQIAGLNEITSSNISGATTISLQFDLQRDIYAAGRDVQAALNAASSLLPTSLPNRPSYRFDNPADTPIIILALTSETIATSQLFDFASSHLAAKILQIPGISQVSVGGGAMLAVRIELNPAALNKYGIGLEDIRNTITQTNVNRPKGSLENTKQRWQIQANDQTLEASDYLPLIVKTEKQAVVTINDLGRVLNSAEDLRNTGINNGKASVLIMVKKQPQANVLASVDAVQALLPEMQADLTGDMQIAVVLDRSIAVRAAIHEVEFSLLMAVFLVFLVVLVFLQDLSSTLIPMISVPVSLISACIVLYFCHYSINNLTLMALTVATGFVVDDAIVVLENCKRHIEAGKSPFIAATIASREVSFTVLAMSLALLAVFLPILFMEGIAGRIFREFAATLATTVVVSLVISVTTTPMLCARYLTNRPYQAAGIKLAVGKALAKLQNFYGKTLVWALNHRKLILVLLSIIIALNIYLYLNISKGFFPTQDDGRLNAVIITDQSSSFSVLKKKLWHFSQLIQQDPAVDQVVGFAGGGLNNNVATVFVVLKPHQQRPAILQVIERIRASASREPGVRLMLYPLQELRVGARPDYGAYNFVVQSDDLDLLSVWATKLQQALSQLPELSNVNSNQQEHAWQINLLVNRELAARYGVTQAMIDTTLQDAFGQRQVSVIYQTVNQYRIIMELAPEYWQNPETLQQIAINVPAKRMANGQLSSPKQVPLSSIASFESSFKPLSVNHQGQFAANSISFNLKPDIALSQAITAIEQATQQLAPPVDIKTAFQGTAKTYQQAQENQLWMLLAALVSIYIVLGILYESYIHPLTLLSTIPSAGIGALLALKFSHTDLTMVATIAILLLIGIVQKNAIMMVDFALDKQRRDGLDSKTAIYQACLQRFRPITMTTLAALLGALPLAFAHGYGAEIRQPLGLCIAGGLLLCQLLTLYTTPVIFLYLEGFRLICQQGLSRLNLPDVRRR